jgi:hypothetical protein
MYCDNDNDANTWRLSPLFCLLNLSVAILADFRLTTWLPRIVGATAEASLGEPKATSAAAFWEGVLDSLRGSTLAFSNCSTNDAVVFGDCVASGKLATKKCSVMYNLKNKR